MVLIKGGLTESQARGLILLMIGSTNRIGWRTHPARTLYCYDVNGVDIRDGLYWVAFDVDSDPKHYKGVDHTYWLYYRDIGFQKGNKNDWED